jgi:transcriptional regulator with XRE-family HTH domain
MREGAEMTLEDLAELVGTSAQQISRLEKGERRLTQEWMQRIAAVLPNSPNAGDLIGPGITLGTDGMKRRPRKVEPDHVPDGPKVSPGARLDEIDVQASAGPGMLDPHSLSEVIQPPVMAQWELPATYLRQYTSSPTERIKIIRVIGTSMMPDFQPGERVMVDLEDRTPSPPGVFVVWDGLAVVLKLIEIEPNTDPVRVRIKSKNPDFGTYERTLGEAYIQGRVIGKWTWT